MPGDSESKFDAELAQYKQELQSAAACLRAGVAASAAVSLEQNSRAASVLRVVQDIATTTGAPYAWGLQSLARAFDALLEARKRRRVLLSGIKASMALVAALPLFGVAMGYLVGFDPLRVLLRGYGVLLLFAAACLMLVGVLWLRRMTAQVARLESLAGYESELVALAMCGGFAAAQAKKLVADAICSNNAEWLNTDELAADGSVDSVLAKMRYAGAGFNTALQEVAFEARRKQLEKLETAAEKLGTKALLPLACCVLPAFILTGVIPLVVAMLQGVGD
ncbi:hypothetical protein KJY77_05205 [Canibacter sp. lx-72]|uniref:hypothetical protein n=1 Tax=Canibacter zhuwentaonis TaxID=2837491 RepID=UPI001BDC11AF|nr:hypothetical protein [Canibacter zhuwentaonis]MBT1018529.1 hypothetical protein [Canibacter zhuwentaonis]